MKPGGNVFNNDINARLRQLTIQNTQEVPIEITNQIQAMASDNLSSFSLY
jgi:hypothetical protein